MWHRRPSVAVAAALLAFATAAPALADPVDYRALAMAEQVRIDAAVTRPPMTPVRKGLLGTAIALVAVDALQSLSGARRGCLEANPLVRPLVHSPALMAVASAAFSFGLASIPRGTVGDAALGAFDAGEALNDLSNARTPC
ncbi:MAG: hypothetical protein WAJ85_10160 [Candidatus Baltobacteraceae bacterium]